MDARDAKIAELEAEITRLRGVVSQTCPFDAPDDPRSDIETDEPCPVCGMFGTYEAEDKCVGGARREASRGQTEEG